MRAGDARFVADQSVWEVVCDIALPCATQNELNGSDASTLVKNGCRLVAEGANMPCTPTRLLSSTRRASRLRREGSECRWRGDQRAGDAAERFAGFVGLRSHRKRLAAIMATIHERCLETADEYGAPGDYVAGANIAGFTQVADSMIAPGSSEPAGAGGKLRRVHALRAGELSTGFSPTGENYMVVITSTWWRRRNPSR